MLFNTTYANKEYTKESNDLVGKAFSFLEKIKMGSVGSSRLIIDSFSAKLRPKNMTDADINYANIELRPKGIIMHFTNRLDRYSWVIPYYRLVIYNTEVFSIHAEGNFIKCKKNKNFANNKKFISRMMQCKNDFIKY